MHALYSSALVIKFNVVEGCFNLSNTVSQSSSLPLSTSTFKTEVFCLNIQLVKCLYREMKKFLALAGIYGIIRY